MSTRDYFSRKSWFEAGRQNVENFQKNLDNSTVQRGATVIVKGILYIFARKLTLTALTPKDAEAGKLGTRVLKEAPTSKEVDAVKNEKIEPASLLPSKAIELVLFKGEKSDKPTRPPKDEIPKGTKSVTINGSEFARTESIDTNCNKTKAAQAVGNAALVVTEISVILLLDILSNALTSVVTNLLSSSSNNKGVVENFTEGANAGVEQLSKDTYLASQGIQVLFKYGAGATLGVIGDGVGWGWSNTFGRCFADPVAPSGEEVDAN